jgi:hypothetical protein
MSVLRDMLVFLVLVAAAVAVIFGLWLHHMIRAHGALVLAGRWHAGRSLDGRPRTNATWSEPATKVLHPSGRAHPWHHLTERKRAAVRLAAELVLALLIYGLFVATGPTLIVLAVVALFVAGLYALHLVYKVRNWQHERHYVRPLERSIMARIGTPPDTLEIERSGAEIKAITMEWPAETEIGEIEKDAVLTAVTDRLAIEAPSATWNTKGRTRSVTFTQSQPPPGLVTLDDVLPAIRAAGPDEIIAGLGRKNTAVPISLDKDSAHIALSIGPGGGKSRAARAMAIQVLYKGGLVVVLNAKKSDYNWTRGLPNVCHAKKVGDSLEPIAEMLLWLNLERMRREDIAEAEGDIEDELPAHVNVGPRIFIVFEEQNLTVPYLKEDHPDAFRALGDLNFAGRSSRMNMLAIAQRYSAKAAGGGDVRAAVNAKILGRYDKDAWQMLAKAHPMPPPDMTPGRVQVVTDAPHETQMPKVGGQEAHDFALSGVVAICPPDMPSRCAVGYVPASQLPNTWPEQRLSQGQPLPALPVRQRMSLREAVEDGVIGLSYEAARQRRKRDRRAGLGEFPADAGVRGTETLHYLDELIEWEDRRTA